MLKLTTPSLTQNDGVLIRNWNWNRNQGSGKKNKNSWTVEKNGGVEVLYKGS